MIKPGAVLAAARTKSGFFDHLVRTYGRYSADTGDRLAAAVTFYWFLSLFPILLLVLSAYGFVHSGESADQLNARLSGSLGGFLPSQLVDTLSETLKGAKGKAGIIGLAGLLLSGLGWIDALREAIRTIWHQNIKAGNIVTRKLADVLALLGLFATIAASAFVTGLAGSGPKWLLGQLGVDKTTAAVVFLKLLGVLLGVAVDVVLFLYLFLRLAKVGTPVRRVLKGAFLGAVGFGLLKLLGGFYVQHTTEKGQATYGTFAVVVGLLLFLNLVSRLMLFASAFVVTAPGDDDVRPSGTADREQAQRAGIPPEYADDSLSIQEDGAPTPLRSSLNNDPVRSWSAQAVGSEQDASMSSAPPLQRAKQVRLAARLIGGIGGLVLVALVRHLVGTFRRAFRRD